MRRLWEGLGLMLATLFGAIGCAAPNITPRPPKHPEEIVVPPLADAKFSNPPKYPDDALNRNDSTKSPNGPGGVNGAPNMSAMNGMGGRGGMSGMGGMGGMGMGGPNGYNGRGY